MKDLPKKRTGKKMPVQDKDMMVPEVLEVPGVMKSNPKPKANKKGKKKRS